MKKMTINYSGERVFDAVKKAAEKLGLEVKSNSISNGKISLYSDGGIFSFGNKIDISIKYADPKKTVLQVNSRSAAAIQIIDWGTNEDLEKNIINEVNNLLHR